MENFNIKNSHIVVISEFSGYNHGSNVGGNANMPNLSMYPIMLKRQRSSRGGSLKEYFVSVPKDTLFITKNQFGEDILAIPGSTSGNIATSPYNQKQFNDDYIKVNAIVIGEREIPGYKIINQINLKGREDEI